MQSTPPTSFDSLTSSTRPAAIPEHLRLARVLVACVTPDTNEYGSPAAFEWPTKDKPVCRVKAKCAPFVSTMLAKAYAVDFKQWLKDTTSPNSARYHKAIVAGDRFTPVLRIADIRPGDVLAIDHRSGGSSGHTAIVDAAPTASASSKPIIKGTAQFDLPIVDVTSSPHGNDDSRVAGDTDDVGVGRGVMRLYADAEGAIVGFTWSVKSSSYHPQTDRPIAFGRFAP